MSLFNELKRRNVFRMALFYCVASWLVLQVGELLFEVMAVPEWGLRLVLGALILGFPITLMIAWVYEVTEEGVKKQTEIDRDRSITHETAKRLDIMTIVLLLGVAGLYLIDNLVHPTFSSGDRAEAVQPPVAEPPPRTPKGGDAGPAPKTAGPTEEESPAAADASDAPPRPVVAVLPFSLRSTGDDDRFFTDGIHDDLLTLLAKLDAFQVISRTSVLEYRDTTRNLREVGQELGATAILEGGVQKAGDRVRINMQLIDVASDAHLWAETFDRELTADNVFDLQSEIARAVSQALKATLSEQAAHALDQRPTHDLVALEAYLKASTLYTYRDDAVAADAALATALERDPAFVQAWALKARIELHRYWFMGTHEQNRNNARAALDRVFALDPDSPEGWLAEGWYHYWGFRDYDRALAALDRALATMPGNAKASMLRGWILRRAGRLAEALESIRQGVELDPRNGLYRYEFAVTLLYVGQFARARVEGDIATRLGHVAADAARFHLMLSTTPEEGLSAEGLDAVSRRDLWRLRVHLGDLRGAHEMARSWPAGMEIDLRAFMFSESLQARTLQAMGEIEQARAMALAALERVDGVAADHPEDFRVPMARVFPLAILGRRPEMLEAGQAALARMPDDLLLEEQNRFLVALAYAQGGEGEASLALLEPAIGKPYIVTIRYLVDDPAFASLKDHPKVQSWLAEFDAAVEADRLAYETEKAGG